MAENRIRVAYTRGVLLGCTALAGALVTPHGALAQSASAQSNTLSEIVVTAQKRSQNLQEVPIAVTAVTPQVLQANRVVNVVDLSGLAPGFTARANAGSLGAPTFIMRGVYATGSVPGSDRQVSAYLDGVYIGISRGSIFDLPDANQIEILRGPQGTLFGRNATAGAVSVTTRDPTGQFHVRQELTAGNYAQFRSRTSVDFPAVGPFSAYLTYVHDQRDGDVKNLGAGTVWNRTNPFGGEGIAVSPARLGDRNFNNFFAAVRFKPTDDFSVTYKIDRSQGSFTPTARVANVVNPSNFVGQMLLSVIAAQPAGGGAYGPVTFNPSFRRPDAVNNAWTVPGFQKNTGHNLTIQWKVNDQITIKNITGYRESTVFAPAVIAGLSGLEFTQGALTPYATFAAVSSVPGFASLPAGTQGAIVSSIASALSPLVGGYFAGYEGNNYGTGKQWSNETQLNYQSKLLTLTVGGLWYHSNELASGLPGFKANYGFAPTPSLLPLGGVLESHNKATSIAAYAQGEVHVASDIDFVLGGRVTYDDKTGSLVSGGTFVGTRTAGTITGETVLPFSYSKTQPTYSVGVNYHPSHDLLLYAKYATAFMSGGSIGGVGFAAETVKSEEVGVKSDLLDRRLRVNLAVYNADYDHSQSAQSGQNAGHPELSTLIVDNGPLKAYGFELEVTAAPMRHLTLGGSASYTNAKLTSPNPLVVTGAGGTKFDLTGVPDWTANLNAQYQSDPVFQNAYLSVRMDANWTDSIRALPDPDYGVQYPVFAPYQFIPSNWIINGRLALRHIDVGHSASGEVALWVRNLTDNKTPLYPVNFGGILNGTDFQPARTFGVDLILDF